MAIQLGRRYVSEKTGIQVLCTKAGEGTLLTVTELGYGKRTPFEQYRVQHRYGKGIISINNKKTGGVVGALEVTRDNQLMLVTDTGRVIRIGAGTVRLVKGRNSQGVRLMRLQEGERIVDIALLEDVDDEEEGEAIEGEEVDGEAVEGEEVDGEAVDGDAADSEESTEEAASESEAEAGPEVVEDESTE